MADQASGRWSTLAVGLSVYAIASLEPLDWEIPARVSDHTERAPAGWRLAAPGIVIANARRRRPS
jgi:adenosyl cobinamide kinase/adenosyl cobinamide phosphate guanylyltransferase